MADTFICAYELSGDGHGTPIDESALRSQHPQDVPVWIHLSARASAAREWLETHANLPDETLADALLAEDTRPRLMSQAGGVLLILRGVNLNADADPEDMVSIRIWIEAKRFISVQLRKIGRASCRERV